MKSVLPVITFLFVFLYTAVGQTREFLYTGTFSVRGSEGIYVFSFDRSQGKFEKIGTFHSYNDPTFLEFSPDKKILYAVNRQGIDTATNKGSVTSFRIHHATGKLSEITSISSFGNSPCHVSVSRDGNYVFASHYRDGALTILSSGKKGQLIGLSDSVFLRGSSINKQRQESAHAHFTQFIPELNFLVTADLGSDKLWIHSFRYGKISKPAYAAIETTPGSGPRHFEFYPRKNWIYVAEELSSTVSQYYFHPDKLTISHLQRISTLPDSFSGSNSVADIHFSPDFKFLYVSNRGHNSLAIYRVDATTGKLNLIGHQPTLGKTPRNFYMDTRGEFVLVANQDTDEIVMFRRDKETGILHETSVRLQVPSPVCLKMSDSK